MARMRSLRLDEQLDDQVRRAASIEGASVSEFLRRAAADRAEGVLKSAKPSELLADAIGVVHSGGGLARDTGKAFTDMLVEEHEAKKRRR